MGTDSKSTSPDDEAAEPPRRRLPYESPRVEQTGSFEQLVLACGPTPIAGQECEDDPEPFSPSV